MVALKTIFKFYFQLIMKTQTLTKNFEIGQICDCGISQTSYYIVTRISKSNVWFKAIPSIIIDDELKNEWGGQKWHSLPNFKVIDGKNVPLYTGKEFRQKLYINDDNEQYCYRPYVGIIKPWMGDIAYNDSM